MQQLVAVERLRKSYGSTVAVDDISFEVTQGEIFGILGPNGAGKTTTVECLQGLRRADNGTMRVLGMDPMTRAESAPSSNLPRCPAGSKSARRSHSSPPSPHIRSMSIP